MMPNITIRFETLAETLLYIEKHPRSKTTWEIGFEDDHMGKWYELSITDDENGNDKVVAMGNYYLHNLDNVMHSFLDELPSNWKATVNSHCLEKTDKIAVIFTRMSPHPSIPQISDILPRSHVASVPDMTSWDIFHAK